MPTLEQQAEILKNRLQQVQNKIKKKQRAARTRQKILIGVYFLDKYDNDIDRFMREHPDFDPYLTRPHDREVFGLDPQPKPEGDTPVENS